MTNRPASVPNQPADRPAKLRSAITNGAMPGGVRKDSAEARRYRDIRDDLMAELGQDLTAAQRLQVDNIAGLLMHAEQMRGLILQGQVIDAEQHVRVTNSADRMLRTLKRSLAPAEPGRGRSWVNPLAQQEHAA